MLILWIGVSSLLISFNAKFIAWMTCNWMYPHGKNQWKQSICSHHLWIDYLFHNLVIFHWCSPFIVWNRIKKCCLIPFPIGCGIACSVLHLLWQTQLSSFLHLQISQLIYLQLVHDWCDHFLLLVLLWEQKWQILVGRSGSLEPAWFHEGSKILVWEAWTGQFKT